jgi:hypothetical protein
MMARQAGIEPTSQHRIVLHPIDLAFGGEY